MKSSSNSIEQKQQTIKLALQEYLATPELERSLTKIGKKYGVKRQTLSTHLKKMGYEVINYQNRVRLDETLFDKIDTEEKAYWLGFLYADGCVDSEGNRIEVHLALKDVEHLEKFRQFLHLENPIRTGKNKEGNYFCHLSVRNKHMWNSLINVGCYPVKSLTLEFPKIEYFENKNLIKHFLRGYVDGDGCLCTYKATNGSTRTVLSMVGTENFLKRVNEICWNKGRIRNKSSKNWENKAFDLDFSDVPSRRIARILYEDATIYLERKYNKFLEFCSIEEESSKRKSTKIGESWDANTEVNSDSKKSESPQSIEVETVYTE